MVRTLEYKPTTEKGVENINRIIRANLAKNRPYEATIEFGGWCDVLSSTGDDVATVMAPKFLNVLVTEFGRLEVRIGEFPSRTWVRNAQSVEFACNSSFGLCLAVKHAGGF